jgi:UDP-glucose 4-epimerase
MPGINVQVTDGCVGCGICVDDICFFEAIRMREGRAFISDACRGCGRCVKVCPQEAIELSIGRPGTMEDVVATLLGIVDISPRQRCDRGVR